MSATTFVTRDLGCGRYAPATLTRQLGLFLTQAEALFGPRDPSFTILGIELVEGERAGPQVWFPPSSEDHKHVIVHLASGALRNRRQALWQLAHECVHLLGPGLTEEATVLSEGIATWFQNEQVGREFMCDSDPYADAERLVLPLMDSLPEAIRHMREEKGVSLPDITAELLREYCPDLSPSLCRELTAPFRHES